LIKFLGSSPKNS